MLANWILAHTNLQPEHLRAITLGLLAAGLINIVLAGGLWYRSWVVRDVALWVLGGAGVLALVALLSTFTLFRLSLLGIDVVIVWYLWRVMPSHLPPRRRALRAHVV